MSTWNKLTPVEKSVLIEERIRRYLVFASDLAQREGNVCPDADIFLMESMKAFIAFENLKITEIFPDDSLKFHPPGLSFEQAVAEIKPTKGRWLMYRDTLDGLIHFAEDRLIYQNHQGVTSDAEDVLTDADLDATDWKIAVQTD